MLCAQGGGAESLKAEGEGTGKVRKGTSKCLVCFREEKTLHHAGSRRANKAEYRPRLCRMGWEK